MLQDREALAPLQEPMDDLRSMLQLVIEDTCKAAEGNNVEENLLEAQSISIPLEQCQVIQDLE